MKILKLERHLYAPELNKIHLKNGIIINCPGIVNIKDFRNQFKKGKSGRYGIIKYFNIDHPSLNTTYSGFLSNGYKDIKCKIESLKLYHNVPNGYYEITTKLINH